MDEQLCQFDCNARGGGKYENYCWIHFVKKYKKEPSNENLQYHCQCQCQWKCINTAVAENLCEEHFKRRYPTRSINEYDLDGQEILYESESGAGSENDIVDMEAFGSAHVVAPLSPLGSDMDLSDTDSDSDTTYKRRKLDHTT